MEEKIFIWANYTAISPFSSPLPLPLNLFYIFCYIISYNITYFDKFFLFFFLDNVMLLIFGCSHKYLIFNHLRAYFSVYYFTPQSIIFTHIYTISLYIYSSAHC